MSETLTNTQIIIKDDNGQIHTSKSLGQQDETRLNNIVKLMNLMLNTPNSTDFINTLATKQHVDSETNNIASDLNGKADVDLTNLNNTGKINVAHLGMPSGIYDNLTLGASGTTYTAPADGYFTIHADLNSNGYIHFVTISNANTILYQLLKSAYTYTINYGTYVPVQKGDVLQINYDGVSQLFSFTFVYAVGSESEQS